MSLSANSLCRYFQLHSGHVLPHARYLPPGKWNWAPPHGRQWVVSTRLPLLLFVLLLGLVSVQSHSSASSIEKGILQPRGPLFREEARAGFKTYRLEVNWDRAQPARGTYHSSYLRGLRRLMARAQAAGMTPVLSLGIEYPPAWVFSLDPSGSRLIDQYGDVWIGNGPGERIANGVFSPSIRRAIASYVAHIFRSLGTRWHSVDWGGGLVYDEVRYPACPGGRTNCYWAFDPHARSQNPVPAYHPGSGDQRQALAFQTWYDTSLQKYILWGMGQVRRHYRGPINVLLPSWGVRPGDIRDAVAANLSGATQDSSEVAGGMNWAQQLPAYARFAPVTIDCTWANRLDEPGHSPRTWSPVHYLASILPRTMHLVGENTAGATSVEDMHATFSNAKRYHLSGVMWMNEASTQLPGNATLKQIGTQ
jgi:hypothetical protein